MSVLVQVQNPILQNPITSVAYAPAPMAWHTLRSLKSEQMSILNSSYKTYEMYVKNKVEGLSAMYTGQSTMTRPWGTRLHYVRGHWPDLGEGAWPHDDSE